MGYCGVKPGLGSGVCCRFGRPPLQRSSLHARLVPVHLSCIFRATLDCRISSRCEHFLAAMPCKASQTESSNSLPHQVRSRTFFVRYGTVGNVVYPLRYTVFAKHTLVQFCSGFRTVRRGVWLKTTMTLEADDETGTRKQIEERFERLFGRTMTAEERASLFLPLLDNEESRQAVRP
jgi:hypothetical protein